MLAHAPSLAIAALLVTMACGSPAQPQPGPMPPRARARVSPPCPPRWVGAGDLHVDLPYQVAFRNRSIDLNEPGVDVTSSSLRTGHVRFLVLSLYLPSERRDADLEDLLDLLATAERIVQANQALFEELEVEIVFGVEGSRALVGHIDQIPSLVARGVRMFGLTHRRHNALADSAQDRTPGSGGLSKQGREFVGAVFAAGAVVDVSHASDDAVRAAVDIALAEGGVVVASHSNARAVADHARNLPDDLLRAIAETGGVVGLNFHSRFLRRRGRASIEDVVAHATHMIDVMGAEHVAIGSDFDGSIAPPSDLRSHADLPALAAELARANIGADEITGIMGRNARDAIAAPSASTRCDGARESRRTRPSKTDRAR